MRPVAEEELKRLSEANPGYPFERLVKLYPFLLFP